MSSSLKSLTTARGFLLSAVVDNWRVILPVVLLLGAITSADARSIDINADNVEADEVSCFTYLKGMHIYNLLFLQSEVIRNRRIPANARPVVDYCESSLYIHAYKIHSFKKTFLPLCSKNFMLFRYFESGIYNVYAFLQI